MSDSLDNAFAEGMSRMNSGAEFDLQVGEDGLTRFVPKRSAADMPVLTPGAYRDPFEISAQIGEQMDIPELALQPEEAAAMGAGIVTGAPISAALAIPDLIGLARAGVLGATAEENKGWETFLNALGDLPSAQVGQMLESVVKATGVDEKTLEAFKGGYLTGEVLGIPTGSTSGFSVLKEALTAPGKPPVRTPRSPRGATLDTEAEAVKQPIVFEALPQRTNIDDIDRAEWEQLSSELKISQPIASAQDAVNAARLNQQVLAGSGEEIAAELGIKFKNPGIKGSEDQGRRMAEKAKSKGGIQQLTDVTRAGFAVDTAAKAEEVVDTLVAKGFKVIDEGYTVTDLGYFDRKILIINPDGQIGEVQIWAEPMFKAKIEDGGQDLYGIWRGKKPDEMDAKELREYKAIVKKYKLQGDTYEEIAASAKDKSVQLYADAINESSEDMQQIAISNLQRMVSEGGKEAETAAIMLERLGVEG